jgi:hypothetical protein
MSLIEATASRNTKSRARHRLDFGIEIVHAIAPGLAGLEVDPPVGGQHGRHRGQGEREKRREPPHALAAENDERSLRLAERAEDAPESERVQHDSEESERHRGRADSLQPGEPGRLHPLDAERVLDLARKLAEEVRVRAPDRLPPAVVGIRDHAGAAR